MSEEFSILVTAGLTVAIKSVKTTINQHLVSYNRVVYT